MARFYTTFLFLLFAVLQSFGQVDTEFWFAPPEVTSGHGEFPLVLRVSTQATAATVRVLQPARGNLELANFTLPPNTTRNLDLTDQIVNLETGVPNTVLKTGLRIVSSAPITAYYEEASYFNAEIFVLKGKNALGNKFIIAAQNNFDNSPDYFPAPYFSFDIVATKDNTVVTVRPTKPLFGHKADSVITIRLNAGETYSLKKPTSLAGDNPTGTLVESSKPIAITIKDDSVINGGCRDLLGDQLVPVEVTGMEYIVLKGFLNTPEFLFITATEDDTEVFMLGINVPIATLDAGETYKAQVNQQASYIVSTKRIYVVHVTGFGCEMGMAILPQVNCTGSKQISFTRSTSEFFGMNILIRKEGVPYFKLNGSSMVHAQQFTPVAGTNDEWYAAQFSFTEAQVPVGQASLIENERFSFQAGIINGNAATSARYGYFSSFSTLFIGDDFNFCEGATATIDAGPGKETYLWSTGETTQAINVAESGEYWVKVTREECVLYDTIRVNARTAKVDLGPDVALCPGDTSKIDGRKNFSWLWSDGSTGQYLETSGLGKYWVNVFDDVGCQASDTILISQYEYKFSDDVEAKINYVSVDTTDENKIKISWSIANVGSEARSTVLYKRKLGASAWELVSSFSATVNEAENVGNLTDDESYEYYVALADACGQEQKFSKVHRTIRLTGQADEEDNKISLTWNNYENWDSDVGSYEVWRKLEDETSFSLFLTLNGSANSFTDDIATDAFHHEYIIKAIETSGRNESWSNSITFEFEHPIYIPNVFTPNDDLFNQYFEITNIELYKNSKVIIVDRWGLVVFEENGYKNDWNGDGLSTGVYYYLVKPNRNSNDSQSGSLTILK